MPQLALMTDQYELTMVESALFSGEAETPCVFEVFTRRLPLGRRYGVVAGTGRFVEALAEFTFTSEQLQWLRSADIVSAETVEWLRSYRFSGNVSGYPEGELYFADCPLLVITGTFAECVVLETLALSMLNYDCAVAAAATRMVTAAGRKPVLELGSRRANEGAAIAAARAAFIGGFEGTSNLAAGMKYGVPTVGTAAHAFTLLHDGEDVAFDAQVHTLGKDTTLLVDTYDTVGGVAAALQAAGPKLGAVRIDSGDLADQADVVRAELDAAGATATQIVATSDLDEYHIADLCESPVDIFGVGTSVVTGSGAPTAGLVYKLVARQDETGTWVPVSKKSAGKATVGGRKWVARGFDNTGVMRAEVVVVSETEPQWENLLPLDVAPLVTQLRPMLKTFVAGGERVEDVTPREQLRAARAHREAAVVTLPTSGTALSHGLAACPTIVIEQP